MGPSAVARQARGPSAAAMQARGQSAAARKIPRKKVKKMCIKKVNFVIGPNFQFSPMASLKTFFLSQGIKSSRCTVGQR